jgi:hypothetical protein
LQRLQTIQSSAEAAKQTGSTINSTVDALPSSSYYQKQQFEHYTFILDEVASKWKMLEMFTNDERSLNQKLNRIVADLAPLKSQIMCIGKACRLDHELLEMNFMENLTSLLKRFEVCCLNFFKSLYNIILIMKLTIFIFIIHRRAL